MDNQKIDMFLMTNAKYFESHRLPLIRERLLKMDDSKLLHIQTLNFKDPTMMLIVSLLAGTLGIDRFLIGDVGLGVAKLLTCGGLGIWAIVDWFLIMGATRDKNMEKLEIATASYSY
ncbi:MAG: TM2 domain-containing protein [Saprospirales bacterium]|nr:MAG: TM2 domain-containing protein [Saprospirales bacterium]